ncbi:MAG: alpha/beta fold hydrolase [Planctomycetes bacterium]|nr:alpha/beta fold hydrolase [Planctomycetota bacterium]
MGDLKRLQRSGWVRAGVPQPESVADHSYRLALLALALAPRFGIDAGRAASIALVHDLAESRTGDLYVHPDRSDAAARRDAKRKEEARILADLLGRAPGTDEWTGWLAEYQTGSSAEGRFVRALDKLEMALSALDYERTYGIDLEEFWESAREGLEPGPITDLLAEIRSRRPALTKGRGTRWIYLHGFASGKSSNKGVFLRDRFAAKGVHLEILDLNLDLEGREAFRTLTISRILATVDRLLDGSMRAVLLGSSLGGYAAALAAARDRRVEAAVLVAPAFGFGRRFIERLPPGALAAGEFETHHHEYGAPRRVSTGLFEDALAYPEFPDLRCPTLIIHGRRDESVPAELSSRFAAERPNVRLVLVDDDHALALPATLETLWRETASFLERYLL